MMAVHLWLASVLVVVVRWSMDPDVISIIYSVLCAAMIDEYIKIFY